MRRLLLIMISFAILCQALNSMVLYAGYELNKAYITKNFCINKDKPKMHCNGKCHLMKELNENEKQESTPVSPIKDKLETIVYLSVNSKIPIIDNNSVTDVSTIYLTRTLDVFQATIFQPPRS